MIQKLVLSALLLGAASANAQTSSLELLHLKPRQQKHFNLINSIIQNNPRSNTIAHKPTAIKQRVIAQAAFGDGYYDSLAYHYSGTNGSQYNFNNFIEPGYSYHFWPDVSPAFEEFYNFPSTDVKADSINRYSVDEHEARAIAFYNSAGLLDSSFSEGLSSMDFSGSYSTKYNSNGKVTSFKQWEIWSGTPWGLWRRLSHNTSGQVLTDSFFYFTAGEWTPTITNQYVYNTLGQLDTLIEPYGAYTFLYDGDGKLVTSKYFQREDDGTLLQADETTIDYTDGADYVTRYQYRAVMGSSSDDFRVVQYPGSNPGPDSFKIFSQAGSSWVETTRAVYAYNEFGNPTLISAAGEELEGDVNMYYEDYDDGLSNNDVFLNKDFAVYPNPFTGNISLDYKGNEQKNVSVSMADITGRTVFQSNIQLQSGNNNIAVPELSAGTYMLQITGESGRVYSNKLIKK